MSLPIVEERIRFHLSLNVPNIAQAVDFYRVLFGQEPAKLHDDYAKFDLHDPPVVFSLVPHAPGAGNTLSHLGIRVASEEKIQEYQERLQKAGRCSEMQTGTTCGYAKQNKLWVRDPFENFWEIYRVEEDVRPELIRTTVDGKAARADRPSCPTHPDIAEKTWEHFVAQPIPESIPHDAESLDEARLIGTYNAQTTTAQRQLLLDEVNRVLKPGGKVVVHGLMADRPIEGTPPTLGGLASMVTTIPAQSEPAHELEATGFVSLQIIKYTQKCWFNYSGAELREVKWQAWKPAMLAEPADRALIYKGPFPHVTVDGGYRLTRGQRTEVPANVWEALRHGPGAEQFVFYEPNAKPAACGIG